MTYFEIPVKNYTMPIIIAVTYPAVKTSIPVIYSHVPSKAGVVQMLFPRQPVTKLMAIIRTDPSETPLKIGRCKVPT